MSETTVPYRTRRYTKPAITRKQQFKAYPFEVALCNFLRMIRNRDGGGVVRVEIEPEGLRWRLDQVPNL